MATYDTYATQGTHRSIRCLCNRATRRKAKASTRPGREEDEDFLINCSLSDPARGLKLNQEGVSEPRNSSSRHFFSLGMVVVFVWLCWYGWTQTQSKRRVGSVGLAWIHVQRRRGMRRGATRLRSEPPSAAFFCSFLLVFCLRVLWCLVFAFGL